MAIGAAQTFMGVKPIRTPYTTHRAKTEPDGRKKADKEACQPANWQDDARKEIMTHTIVVQKWEESERGWGIRPDGFSIHPSMEALKKYIERYWDGMPDSAPDEYSRPCCTPYLADVDDETWEQIQKSKDGLGTRSYGHDYPGDGGSDGWKNVATKNP